MNKMSYNLVVDQSKIDELMLKYNFALQSLETQLNLKINIVLLSIWERELKLKKVQLIS